MVFWDSNIQRYKRHSQPSTKPHCVEGTKCVVPTGHKHKEAVRTPVRQPNGDLVVHPVHDLDFQSVDKTCDVVSKSLTNTRHGATYSEEHAVARQCPCQLRSEVMKPTTGMFPIFSSCSSAARARKTQKTDATTKRINPAMTSCGSGNTSDTGEYSLETSMTG